MLLNFLPSDSRYGPAQSNYTNQSNPKSDKSDFSLPRAPAPQPLTTPHRIHSRPHLQESTYRPIPKTKDHQGEERTPGNQLPTTPNLKQKTPRANYPN